MRVQSPLSPAVGYRTWALTEKRIAGLGQVVTPLRKPLPTSRVVIEPAHPDTPAYDFGGSWPTPFNDWTGWTSIFTPLAKPQWIYNMPDPPRIGSFTKRGGPILPKTVKYGTFRDVPFFKAIRELKEPPWKGYPLYPDRSAPNRPGGIATHFRVLRETNDTNRVSQMWPHIPAGNHGDVPAIMPAYLRVLPNVLPSGTYIQARVRRQPRHYIPNTHQIDPRAVKFELGTKPGFQEANRPDEVWTAANGLGEWKGGWDWCTLLTIPCAVWAIWELKNKGFFKKILGK